MKARVILNLDCDKHCANCCNTKQMLESATPIKSILDLPPCDELLLTGGEPTLHLSTLDKALLNGHKIAPKVYLYTARFEPLLHYWFNELDGIQYTLHDDATDEDALEFHRFQMNIIHRDPGRRLSTRLSIIEGCMPLLHVWPSAWNSIRLMPWQKDCPLPQDEQLFRIL